MRGGGAALAIATAVGLGATPAAAEPQGNASLTLGAAASSDQAGTFGDHAEFHLGLRGDVMFLRESPWDFGLGPYAEVGTFAFDQLQFGGGASFHLPVHDAFPLVASLGAHGRFGADDGTLRPGIGGTLFWGTRSFNYHGSYIMAAGLLVGYRHTFGVSPDGGPTADEKLLTVTTQLDLVALSLPVVMLIDVLRGPSDDARPIARW